MDSLPYNSSPVKAVWTAFGIFLACVVLLKIQALVFALFASILVGLALSFPVDYLQRRFHLHRWLAVLITLIGILLLLAGFLAWVIPNAIYEGQLFLRQLPNSLQSIAAKLDGLSHRFPALATVSESLRDMSHGIIPDSVQNALGGMAQGTLSVLLSGLSGAVVAMAMLVVIVSLVGWPSKQHTLVVMFFPPGRKVRVGKLLDQVIEIEKSFLGGQVIVMAVMGLLIGVGLWIAGIDYPLLFGVLTGILCFIPTVGVLSSMIPPLLIGLSMDNSHALYVLIVFTIVWALESNVIYPVVMSRRVELPPALTIITILVAGELFGFWGVLLAIPMVTAGLVLLEEAYRNPKHSVKLAHHKQSEAHDE